MYSRLFFWAVGNGGVTVGVFDMEVQTAKVEPLLDVGLAAYWRGPEKMTDLVKRRLNGGNTVTGSEKL